MFRLEQGGDYRVIIMDNHRPFHLANVHSAYSVALIDDSSGLTDTTPSDGDDLSSGIESSDEESDEDEDNEVPVVLISNITSYGISKWFRMTT